MRAKSVNEEQNFERGQDPKKAMGIGWDMEKYVDREMERMGYGTGGRNGEKDFWEEFYQGMGDLYDRTDLIEIILDLVDKTPPEYQKEWIDEHLSNYEDEE